MHLSLIIPVYNEEKYIENTLRTITNYLKNQPYKSEIIVVDDGSTDNSNSIIHKFPVKYLKHKKNKGKGAAIKTGALNAKGSFIGFIDADLPYPIQDIEKMLDNNYDIIIASRAVSGAKVKARPPHIRKLLGKLFNQLSRLLIKINIKDTQSGFKIFKKQAAKKIFSKQKINGFCFDVELLYLAKKYNYKIKQIPVNLKETHSFKNSKVNIITDPIKMFIDLLKIKLNDVTKKYQLNE